MGKLIVGADMSEFRVVNAELSVEFEKNNGAFEAEFSSSHNGLDEFMSLLLAKEKGDNTDPLTIKILTEVLRKLDRIEGILSGKDGHKTLECTQKANKIGYEGFVFENACLQSGQEYFARVNIVGFVHKDIKLFFSALDEKTAKITRISKIDEKEWASNVARYEIGAIRANKKRDGDEY